MCNRKAKKKCALAFDESGSIGVIAAIIFTTICGFGGLALDFGHYYKVKAELQRTADAGALAGVTGFIPYTGTAPKTPYWTGGEALAIKMITDEHNKADDIQYTTGDATIVVESGYWLLKPVSGDTQTLPKVRPDSTKLPEPAVKVTLSRDVTMYLAPLIGFSGPMKATGSATAILPEVYGVTGVPPIGVDIDTVYNIGPGDTLTIDFTQQDIKPQSNKGVAGWINLNGGNSVPSVRFDVPLFANPGGPVQTGSSVYFTPGTEATLMGSLVHVGETLILPVVDFVEKTEWKTIQTWCEFVVDEKDANSMTGHFKEIGYVPGQKPDARPAGLPETPFVWDTPKLVSP
ncbi:MAG: pilus assembly protein TadG-related protein [Deltaproteobacteria bacterium]|nr:pilus assembly protein TadG-related protein [Deltaproteobacteria bacterium]